MPTYQYRCTECEHNLEVFQRFTDPSLTECPQCGRPLRKVFNAVGVVFKGSGFYATDSRAQRPAAKPAAEKAGSDKPAADKGAAASTSAPQPAAASKAS